jgi:hypothetical protein
VWYGGLGIVNGPDKLGHDDLDAMSANDAPKIECEVTFLAKSEEGWGRSTVPFLNGNTYRPHLVVGDPNQRQPILTTHSYEVENTDGSKSVRTTDKWIDEEYVGISFDAGPENAVLEESVRVKLILMFWPGPQYEKLQPGNKFTVREGGTVVGFGSILSAIFLEPMSGAPRRGHAEP